MPPRGISVSISGDFLQLDTRRRFEKLSEHLKYASCAYTADRNNNNKWIPRPLQQMASGRHLLKGRRVARGLEQMESALEEVWRLGQWGCRMCWMLKGSKEAAKHRWSRKILSTLKCMGISLEDYRHLLACYADMIAVYFSWYV
jgi:hypothetical protein